MRRFNVLHCERVRLGTPYPEVVHRVRAILDRIGPDAEFIVDAAGVADDTVIAVDLFSSVSGIYPIAVTFTAGEAVVESEGGYRVPKRDLVSTVEVLLQEGRLKIARGIRESSALIDELLSFRAGVSSSGRDTFGAAGSAHDDLVIALALACWRARELEKQPSRMPVAGISEHYTSGESRLDEWLGNPANQFRGGYRQPSRFVPGVGSLTGVRAFWTRIR